MIKDNILDHCISVDKFCGGVHDRYEIDGLNKGDFIIADITYPLTVPARVVLTWNENRYDLAAQICNEYRRIYKEEEETSENKEQRMCDENPECTLINRNRTSGKYGIWGHHIGDLCIEGIVINPVTKSAFLYIGS